MATFNNTATLTFNDRTIQSNTVTGEITPVLGITKTAVGDRYAHGDTVTYAVSVTNSGDTAYTAATLTDNLGAYAFGTRELVPLTYVPGSLRLYQNGVLQTTPVVSGENPLVIDGITVPAGGNVLIVYATRVNQYAPLGLTTDGTAAAIVNTATLTDARLPAPITASATISADSAPALTITKSLCPATVSQNGTLRYTFVIQNTGATPVTAEDEAAIADTFETRNGTLAVTFNGTAWVSPTQYTYNDETGAFTTVPGQVVVPAATYTQNAETGVWSIVPGVSELILTGTGVSVR